MKQIKIAFFDIDGTLVDHALTDELSMIDRTPLSAQKALKKLESNGIMPIIATGRGLALIRSYVKDLGISSYITSNGQNIVYQNEEIYRKFLTNEQVEAVIALLAERKLPYFYETLEKRIYIPQNDAQVVEKAQDFAIGKKEDYRNLAITQIIVHPENVRNFEMNVPGVQAKVVTPTVINILPAEISKATAIAILLEKLNLTPDHAIAFGDEENDFEMFDSVGTSVAMGNAIPSLKAKASYVTDELQDDGIYNACVYFGLI